MAQQRKNPYPRNNFSIVADYLEEIALLLANERGLFPITEENGGYQDIPITNKVAQSLSVPEKAVSASIFIEADAATTKKENIIRIKENGASPTTESGQLWGHKEKFHPAGKPLLEKLRFIGIQNDRTHYLRVQYYATGQDTVG